MDGVIFYYLIVNMVVIVINFKKCIDDLPQQRAPGMNSVVLNCIAFR